MSWPMAACEPDNVVMKPILTFCCASTGGCSSATTLIMNGLEFGGQELSKRPDMLGQSSGHSGGLVAPLGLDQSCGAWLWIRERHAPTPMRSGEVVAGLQENHTPPHVGAILTATPTLTHQRRQSLAQGKVETLKHTGADRQPPFLEAFGTAAYTRDECLETALV